MPDGQGVWHYDDEVNICTTYLWLLLFLSLCLYCVFMTILYLSLKVCVTLVALLLFFYLISLVLLCCSWYCSPGSFDLLVLLLCCELIQLGVVGSGWSFFFVPVPA